MSIAATPLEVQQPVAAEREVTQTHPWVKRIARLLAISTFPLIWLGGLVTTYDAGMAVPDWPGTYGYNLFVYPWQAWLYGPFDLFVEHGHRLLASFVGLVAIVFVISAYRFEARPLIRRLAWLCLATVIFQGILGGARVLMDARTVAMIHGCLGPAFFALCVVTVVHCSDISRWSKVGVWSLWFVRFAVATTIVSYLQLTLGAQLRHILPGASPKFFMTMVHLHLTFAAMVLLSATILAAAGLREPNRYLRRPALVLVGLVIVQILLGIGTWIVNYALPWSDLAPDLSAYIVHAKGYWESMIITMHQATGSLIIAVAILVATRGWLLSPK
jgi:cytochrome c oxidase assembly protein subunit 15